MSIRRRLDRIEAQLTTPDEVVSWAAVDAAWRRESARVRLKMCDLLGVDPGDSRYTDAAALLIDDSAALRAQNAATLAIWRRQEGIVDETEGARERLGAMIEQIAARLSATPAPLTRGEPISP